MKNIIEHINKTFDHRVRLGIMSALVVNEAINFTSLKELLGVTDGNLASHLKALEKAEYIDIKKEFIGKKPNTEYSCSDLGRQAFKKHINAIEQLIKNQH